MHSEDSPQRDDTKLQSPISLNPTRENEATIHPKTDSYCLRELFRIVQVHIICNNSAPLLLQKRDGDFHSDAVYLRYCQFKHPSTDAGVW
jgi:hypothetical protein